MDSKKPSNRQPRAPRATPFGEVYDGGLCLYHGHSLGKFSSRTLRYEGSDACVRCTAAAREGRMNLNLNALRGAVREKALDFWSNVDIGWADECWEWQGPRVGPNDNPVYRWRRGDLTNSPAHHPQRVAMWLSWGDLGKYRVKSLCGNRYCCNPYHLTPTKIGVCLDSSNVDEFELQADVLRLKQEVMGYKLTLEEREIERNIDDMVDPIPTELVEKEGSMYISNDSQHAKNLSKVVEELLHGNHSSSLDHIIDLNEDDL
jgi:hypothetical protein